MRSFSCKCRCSLSIKYYLCLCVGHNKDTKLVRRYLKDLIVRMSVRIFRTEVSYVYSMELCMEVDHKHIYVLYMKILQY
jgi:hypothetical protein